MRQVISIIWSAQCSVAVQLNSDFIGDDRIGAEGLHEVESSKQTSTSTEADSNASEVADSILQIPDCAECGRLMTFGALRLPNV